MNKAIVYMNTYFYHLDLFNLFNNTIQAPEYLSMNPAGKHFPWLLWRFHYKVHVLAGLDIRSYLDGDHVMWFKALEQGEG